MKIDFPDHPVGPWQGTPWWLFWKQPVRRLNWRWIVDHRGCHCTLYWEYAK
jgi:hypothetical protein